MLNYNKKIVLITKFSCSPFFLDSDWTFTLLEY